MDARPSNAVLDREVSNSGMRCKGRPQKKESADKRLLRDDVGDGELNIDNSFNKIRVRGFLGPVGGGRTVHKRTSSPLNG